MLIGRRTDGRYDRGIVQVIVGRRKESNAIRAVRSGGSDLTVVGEVTCAVYTDEGGSNKTCFERFSNVF